METEEEFYRQLSDSAEEKIKAKRKTRQFNISFIIFLGLCALALSLAAHFKTGPLGLYGDATAVLIVFFTLLSSGLLPFGSVPPEKLEKEIKALVAEKIKNYPAELTAAGENFKQADKEMRKIENEFRFLEEINKKFQDKKS